MFDLNADPWTWPEWSKSIDLCCLIEAGGLGPDAPIFKYAEVLRVRGMRAEIEKGNGLATLAAVSCCAQAGLCMPDWLAAAFLRRYRAVTLNLVPGGWNDVEAFGPPYPTGERLKTERRYNRFGLGIWLRVRALIDAGQSFTAACDQMEVEMGAAPESWGGWAPNAKTIGRIYKVEEGRFLSFMNRDKT